MKVVLAIDSFKGCLTSFEANASAAEGVRSVCPDAQVVQVRVSDGGEGFIEAFSEAIGGERITVKVKDPLMRPLESEYLLSDKTAVIEIAKAAGLSLLSTEERNPLIATSYGVGLFVADAVKNGAKQIIVGLGGSATSDAGIGMLQALIDVFAPGGKWDDIKELSDIKFTIASDVRNELFGKNGAAHIFAPQKGATPQMVIELDEKAKKFAELSALHFGYDRSHSPGAGAAGGLGYAFLQYLNADCVSGIDLLLEKVGFKELTKDANLVITGEGSADKQTLMGKLPVGVLRNSSNAKVALIAGKILDKNELLGAGFSFAECINPEGISLEVAMQEDVAKNNIRLAVITILSRL